MARSSRSLPAPRGPDAIDRETGHATTQHCAVADTLLFAGIRDVGGGRAGACGKTTGDARSIALTEMCEWSEAERANAVIGMHTDVEAIGTKGKPRAPS